MDTSQLIAAGILIALGTGFIDFRIGRAIGRSPVKRLESELEQWQQASYSRTRINNEGKWVDATVTGIYSTAETEPGFTNYTIDAQYLHPATGTVCLFSDTFSVNDDSISANNKITELQTEPSAVCVLVVFNSDPLLFWMARPW